MIKMKILTKAGDEIILIYHPSEQIEVGENLILIEESSQRGLLVQVIEENLVDLPGILEDIVRREAIASRAEVTERTPSEIEKIMLDIRNMKAARTKIRKEIRNGEILPWTGWTPSREVQIKPLPDEELAEKLGIGIDYTLEIGETIYNRKPLKVSGFDFQGINVIVGKKGTGKSHLAKTILLGLIDNGARSIVFDINDEYSALRYLETGEKSEYYDKIITLEPNPPVDSEYKPLKFTLDYIGLEVIYTILTQVLNLPEASAYSFRENWDNIKEVEDLDPDLVESKLLDARVSRREIEAIRKRVEQIRNTGVITPDPQEETKIEELLESIKEGGAIIINLKAKSVVTQQIVVQTIITKIQEILEKPDSTPIFLFAEEAHLYLQRTIWTDIVTRMRHLGAFQFYMTNTPTSLDELIIRQTDNIFIFNLTNRSDLNHLLPATKIDEETIFSITKALPPRTFLAIGQATGEYPFIAQTKPLKQKTAGKTKLLWKRNK